MDLAAHIASSCVEGTIDALALAVIERGVVRYACAGCSGGKAQKPVTEHTVFGSASLSKPVFTYVVLKLVDQGVLSLDAPLVDLVDYAPGDEFAAQITAADVLSHMTGFPNWRSAEEPLKSHFRPGDRFSYSGEGFVFLQVAIERLTGESLDAIARRLVFEPLGMTRSTFDLTRGFVDETERAGDAARKTKGNAAYSLQTTAHDYAQFLRAVLDGKGLKATTSQAWMEARALVPANFVNTSEPRRAHQTDPTVAWGLGWGLETESHHFFQWGTSNSYVSFTIGSRADKTALVLLTTGFTGLECLRRLVEICFPGPRASLAWLGRRTDL